MKTRSGSKILESMLRRYCAEAGSQLQSVCLHALEGGGRTRANLLLRASECNDTAAYKAACALEMMHAATLLQDDIFDRSAERRGRRTAYLAFGEAQAVLASDWLLLRSLEVAAEVDPAFFQQLACAARTMAATVAKELHPPALSGFAAARSYIHEICQGKTAVLFAVSLHGAALLHPEAGRTQAHGWAAVGSRVGCTYQFLDDCLDVYAPAGSLNKSTGVDLLQGRLTLPLLTALEALQSGEQHMSMKRFRDGHLTTSETRLVERALSNKTVRAQMAEQVHSQMRSVKESARIAAIAPGAISPLLHDMEAKATLCFGENHADQGAAESKPLEESVL